MPHVSLLCFYAYRLYLTCDMYKCSLRHIHDPVLLSLMVEVVEVICYILLPFCFNYSLRFKSLYLIYIIIHSQLFVRLENDKLNLGA